MKKKLFIIILLIGFIFPIIVNANSVSDIFDVYDYEIVIDKDIEVTCINPKTKKIREITLKKGETRKIFGEGYCIDYYNHELDYSGLCFKDKDDVCQYGLSSDDDEKFHIKNLEYDINKNKKDIDFSINIDAILFNTYHEQIELYSGPSDYYKVIKEINKNEKIKVLGKINGYDWYYIETANTKGWININNLLIKDSNEYINARTVKVYEDQESKKQIGELKVNAIIKNPYTQKYSNYYYINYNDKKGYIFTTELFKRRNGNTTTKYEGILYEEADVNSKQLIKNKIKKGQKITYDSIYEETYYTYNCGDIEELDEDGGCDYKYSWYHTTIDSKTGWLLVSEYLNNFIADNIEVRTDEDNNDSHEEVNYDIIKEEINIESFIIKEKEIKADEKLYIDIKIDNKSNLKVDKILVGFKNTKNEDRMIYLNDVETSPYINIDHNLFENGEFDLYFVRLELNDEGKTRLVYYADDIKNKNKYSLKVINDKKIEKEDEQVTEEKKEDQALKQIHEINNKHLIIGIVSAISITITSIILIILINKRMKNKN